MNGRAPEAPDETSRLSRYLRNIAAFLMAALALTSLARSLVRIVDRTRARLRKLWAPAAP